MFAADATAAEFGTKGGPEPANIDETATVLRQNSCDMKLLISYSSKVLAHDEQRMPTATRR
jgi:hypothetical protein